MTEGQAAWLLKVGLELIRAVRGVVRRMAGSPSDGGREVRSSGGRKGAGSICNTQGEDTERVSVAAGLLESSRVPPAARAQLALGQ